MKKHSDCERDVTIFSCDQEAREILLMGMIDTNAAHDFIAALRQLDRDSSKNINLVICSEGGQDDAGFAIYDAISLAKSKVIASVYGECKSIAVLILQACDTKLLAPNARLMVHNGSTSLNDCNLNEIKAYSKEFVERTASYVECLAEGSGLTLNEVQSLCDKETFMNAELAVTYGFADYILGKDDPKTQEKTKARAKGKN